MTMQASTPVSSTAAAQAAPRLQATLLAAAMMKAIHHDRYGPLDLLSLRDIEQPIVGDTDVLIRVRAAGLHIGDCFGVHGSPFPMRLVSGLRKPIYGVPGFDVAGLVEAVGSKVTQFRPGDAVFGACKGACAEFVCAPASTLALKPARLTFEQAAALPTSGLAALHALRDAGRVRPGQRVLINGASGGVGTFAVQMAKVFGAEVTGVCSSGNVDLVRSLGADHVIDHTQQDFTQGGQRYDLILDNVENRSLAECRRVLTPSGTLILNSGTGAQGMAMLIRLLKPLVLSPFVRQSLKRYLSIPSHADLIVMTELVEAGQLTPVIDKTYPLHETAAALRHIEGGHARGKVVVSLPG
jgi:NADPH:quinone reductase-like Zn-dependent oxidoreductase